MTARDVLICKCGFVLLPKGHFHDMSVQGGLSVVLEAFRACDPPDVVDKT